MRSRARDALLGECLAQVSDVQDLEDYRHESDYRQPTFDRLPSSIDHHRSNRQISETSAVQPPPASGIASVSVALLHAGRWATPPPTQCSPQMCPS